MLSRQNDELQKANTELADYELLVDKYTELAARQEVADYIDISVRYRIMQSFDQAKQMKQENSDSDISKIALDQLQQECRRALADVRSLVKKISS
jgi:ATP-dependent helicase/DNAse subunit B